MVSSEPKRKLKNFSNRCKFVDFRYFSKKLKNRKIIRLWENINFRKKQKMQILLKQKKHQIFSAVALAVFLFFHAASASGNTYDFFVDARSVETQEDGTENYPFKTIGAALNYIRDKKLKNKKLYIKKGTYPESVELVNNTDLFGEDRNETVIDGEGRSYGILFYSTKSQIRNLTVKRASTSLKVDKKSKVTIENCSIKNSGKNGIEVSRSSYAMKYKFTFKNSSVKDSRGRGIYIFKRKIEILGNDIESNSEEGIDLHGSVRGRIISNNIRNNKESGIEMIMTGVKVSIRENDISNNGTQGVTIQVYNSRFGKVRLTKNSIQNNDSYGVRYARYDRDTLKMSFRDFIKKCIKLNKNAIGGNLGGDFAYR